MKIYTSARYMFGFGSLYSISTVNKVANVSLTVESRLQLAQWHYFVPFFLKKMEYNDPYFCSRQTAFPSIAKIDQKMVLLVKNVLFTQKYIYMKFYCCHLTTVMELIELPSNVRNRV